MYGCLDIVKLLIEEYKVDPNIKDDNGKTPLMMIKDSFEIFEYLVGLPGIAIDIKDSDKHDVFYYYSKNKYMVEALKFLNEHYPNHKI